MMSGIRTSYLRDVAREVAVNTAMRSRRVREARLRRPRNSSAFDGSLDLLDRYAFQALRGLERLVGPVRNRTIIEFGPGDHLAAGLAMLAAGATSYTAADRFVPDYSSSDARRWYEGVRHHWPDAFPEHPWPDALDPTCFPEAYPNLVYTSADGVESLASAASEIVDSPTYDIVTSWQVGEHVSDIEAFAEATAALLSPSGVAVHCVDFGPHDCWLDYDDPLTFLHVPPRVWAAMSSHRGSPNRRRHHEFEAALIAAGLGVESHDRIPFEPESVDASRLHPQFRSCPPESLMTRGITYVCRFDPITNV